MDLEMMTNYQFNGLPPQKKIQLLLEALYLERQIGNQTVERLAKKEIELEENYIVKYELT